MLCVKDPPGTCLKKMGVQEDSPPPAEDSSPPEQSGEPSMVKMNIPANPKNGKPQRCWGKPDASVNGKQGWGNLGTKIPSIDDCKKLCIDAPACKFLTYKRKICSAFTACTKYTTQPGFEIYKKEEAAPAEEEEEEEENANVPWKEATTTRYTGHNACPGSQPFCNGDARGIGAGRTCRLMGPKAGQWTEGGKMYGTAAVSNTLLNGKSGCGKCYELELTEKCGNPYSKGGCNHGANRAAAGKRITVMVTNLCPDLPACPKNWGQKNVYGKSVHFDICWHQNLLGNMDNAMVKYREVSCPGAITRHMDCTGDHKNEDNEEKEKEDEGVHDDGIVDNTATTDAKL